VSGFEATCLVENFSSNRIEIYRYIHICIYTDPDPQFLAAARSLEIGQECPVFDVPTWQSYAQEKTSVSEYVQMGIFTSTKIPNMSNIGTRV